MNKQWKMIVVAALAVFACATVQAQETITTAGSSTIRPIVDASAKAFKVTHPKVNFVVGGGGSSHGVKAAGTGEVMLGQCSRFVKEQEMKEYPDLVPFKIGLDGVAVIVNADNGLPAISKEQVRDIYTGKVTNWKELGGKDAPIFLVTKEEGRSTLELFLEYFELESKELDENGKKVTVHRKKGDPEFSTVRAQIIGDNKEAIAAVATKPDAIAYVSVGTAQEIAKRGAKIHLLTLDGVPATIENVGNETYPFRRPLHVVTKGEPQGTLKEFVDFMLSEEGQKIVQSLEFIRVN
ncbi:MAG: phosphate ABC transporter substrate-binding protein [Desulfobulbus sp.]|nr:MAG: phosphate ABC transporter substrate-binding protein [Desulfobulbus sp.]